MVECLHMQQIGSLFAQHPLAYSSRRSERGDLLEFFHQKINATRDGKRFRKLPISAIAVKLSLYSLNELYFLKSTCVDAERRGVPFSAVFWSTIKPRPAQQKAGQSY